MTMPQNEPPTPECDKNNLYAANVAPHIRVIFLDRAQNLERQRDALSAEVTRLTRERDEAQQTLTFHGHRIEARRNEGERGMPQGDCQCFVCRPVYTELSKLRVELAALREVRAKFVLDHLNRICGKCGHDKDEDGNCATCILALLFECPLLHTTTCNQAEIAWINRARILIPTDHASGGCPEPVGTQAGAGSAADSQPISASYNWLALRKWQLERIAEERRNQEAFFMDFPDRWYERPTYGCENGHLSHRFLKVEAKGSMCMTCREPLFLLPPETTEEELKAILSQKVIRHAQTYSPQPPRHGSKR